MSDNKKYYYLKLKDNFFDSEALIILESMPDGHMYSNILLKLYLRSLKNEGRLMFNSAIPYNPTILAQITRHNVGVVEKAINIFEDLGLIDILDNGAIYMLDIQNFIGRSSTEADRKREYRARIEAEKEGKLLEGQMSGQTSDKSPPEIEIEIERELEIETKTDTEKDSGRSGPEIDKNLSLIAKEYEQCGFGTIDMRTKEHLESLLEEYSVEWIVQAFGICVEANKRTIKYAKGILNNWKTEGGMKLGGKENDGDRKGSGGSNTKNEKEDKFGNIEGVTYL